MSVPPQYQIDHMNSVAQTFLSVRIISIERLAFIKHSQTFKNCVNLRTVLTPFTTVRHSLPYQELTYNNSQRSLSRAVAVWLSWTS